MTRESLRILITGVGAPGIRGTLYALRHNPQQVPVSTVGVDIREDAVGRYMVDAFHRVPEPNSEEYAATLSNLCRQESIDVILPQTTREVEVLAGLRDAFASRGAPIMVSSPEAIQIANHKGRLLDRCRELGIPVPQSRLVASEEALVEAVKWLGYPARPVVVKPPLSNGERGVRVLRPQAWNVTRFLTEKPSGLDITLEDLLAILLRGPGWPKLLVSEYLEGPEYSVDAFVGVSARVAIPRLRKAIRGGISFENVLDYNPVLVDYTLQAAKAIGLQYTFGFQFKLDSLGVPRVLECNPRVQGTMVASVFSGVNVIWMGVQELLGEPPGPPASELQPAKFLRYWGGLGIAGDEVHEI